jgi:hypothetical protein
MRQRDRTATQSPQMTRRRLDRILTPQASAEPCNSPMQDFLQALKVERVYRWRHATRVQSVGLINWIEGFYDTQRMDPSIAYRSHL